MSEKDCTLVVLAAGMGSRYGGLKQLDPVGPSGEAILDYSVYDAMKVGFSKVVFIIRKDFEDVFKDKVIKKYTGYIDVDYVFQDLNDLPCPYKVPDGRTKPWGTTHAMLCTKNVINTPFAIINADDFYGRDAYATLYDYLISDEINQNNNVDVLNFAMVGFMLENTLSENGSVARGICQANQDGHLTRVEELLKVFKTDDGAEDRPEDGPVRKLSGKEPVSMNMWAFSPEVFKPLEKAFVTWLDKNVDVEKSECFIPVEMDNFIKNKIANIKVLPTNSKWFGVTYKEDKPKVMASIQDLIDKGLYPAKLF